MSKNYVQIDPKDNIIVAITPLEKGLVTQVSGKQVVLKENIQQKSLTKCGQIIYLIHGYKQSLPPCGFTH